MPDVRAPASRRPRSLIALATGLVLAVVVASGCAAIPSSGGPQSAPAPPAPGDGAGHCCGLLVRGPQPDWSPEQVVRNFLLASAIATNDYSVARKYLTTQARRAWHPGPTVTILAAEPRVSEPSARLSGGSQGPTSIPVTGQELATLNSAGQYVPAQGGKPAPTEDFALQWQNGYRIAGLSPASPGKFSQLLLTSTLFHLVYTPRNLYYFDLSGRTLLPYPVYVPSQGNSSPGALVKDLIHGPGGWLEGAAQTAFPAGARLVGIDVFPGPPGGRTAVVSLALPGPVTESSRAAMAAQLVTTLTSTVYGPPLFRAVKIRINGHPWSPRGPGGPLDLAFYQGQIPHWPAGSQAYYLSQGNVRSLTGRSNRSAVVLRAGAAGQAVLSQIAVSPDGAHLAGLAGPATTLYTGDLAPPGSGGRQTAGQLHQRLTGAFTGMSWDSAGNLWVAGRTGHTRGVWVLFHGQGAAVTVTPPAGLTSITGLRVAPDGVRVALIVGSGAGAHLALAAAIPNGNHTGFSLSPAIPIGSGLASVSALTWYDEDHLLVVTGAGVASQAWEVPVDGNNPAQVARLPGIATITAAGPKNPFYLGMTSGRLQKAVALGQPLSPVMSGQAVIYPG